MLQQLNQIDTEFQHDKITLENSYMTPSTSKKVPTQQVTSSEFSIPLPFGFHVMAERQKRAFISGCYQSYWNSYKQFNKVSAFRRTLWEVFSTALIREQHDSCFIIINIRLVNQFLLMYFPLKLLTQEKKTFSLESFRRQKTQEIFVYRFRMYPNIFWIKCNKIKIF